ncbi:MAG: MOSC domain-containing protein [Rhodospirillales bacterium]|nr:MAG: MOSC domain-containing protein [Rhodospirillales bacterium]
MLSCLQSARVPLGGTPNRRTQTMHQAVNVSPNRSDDTRARGTVEGMFCAPAGGAAMVPVATVTALPGRGLDRDRYGRGTGSFHDNCQVTLIAGEHLDRIAAEFGVKVLSGEHRRNIVTRGIDHASLVGRRFRVGEAVLEYQQPRLPCAYLVEITEPRMGEALGEQAGICARVVEGGVIRTGDAIALLD